MSQPPIPMIKELHLFQHGGIGDQIVALPFINLFKDKEFKVTLYTKFKDIASIFLPWANIKTRGEFPKDAPPPFWIEIIDIIKINYYSRNIIFSLPKLLQDIFHAYEMKFREWGPLITRHPGSCNDLAKKAVSLCLNRNNLIFYLSGQTYKKYDFDIKEVPRSHEFITVHDGFDNSHEFEISTKSWNMDHWKKLIKGIKTLYPNLGIIQIGGEKHRPIKGVDINLAGKLDFRNSLRYLKTSVLHIDGDSGLVHARALFSKPSIVIFGPTNIDYFGYEDNINIGPVFCGGCWWIKNDWMKKCVKDYPFEKASKCMESITYGHVLGQVMTYMDEKEKKGPQKPKTHSPLLDFNFGDNE